MNLASLLVTKIQYFSWKITYGLGVAASARQKSYIKMRLGDYPYYFASHNANIMPTYCSNVIGCRGFCEQDLQLRHQRPMKSGSNLSSQAGWLLLCLVHVMRIMHTMRSLRAWERKLLVRYGKPCYCHQKLTRWCDRSPCIGLYYIVLWSSQDHSYNPVTVMLHYIIP